MDDPAFVEPFRATLIPRAAVRRCRYTYLQLFRKSRYRLAMSGCAARSPTGSAGGGLPHPLGSRVPHATTLVKRLGAEHGFDGDYQGVKVYMRKHRERVVGMPTDPPGLHRRFEVLPGAQA